MSTLVGTLPGARTVIFTFLLNTLYGCAKSTPTENIIDGHIEHINQTLS